MLWLALLAVTQGASRRRRRSGNSAPSPGLCEECYLRSVELEGDFVCEEPEPLYERFASSRVFKHVCGRVGNMGQCNELCRTCVGQCSHWILNQGGNEAHVCGEGRGPTEDECLAAVQGLLPPGATQGRKYLVVDFFNESDGVPPGCSAKTGTWTPHMGFTGSWEASEVAGGLPNDFAAHYNRNPAYGTNGGDYVTVCPDCPDCPASGPPADLPESQIGAIVGVGIFLITIILGVVYYRRRRLQNVEWPTDGNGQAAAPTATAGAVPQGFIKSRNLGKLWSKEGRKK